jgi:O-antigen/teichoic acid export membrane protein
MRRVLLTSVLIQSLGTLSLFGLVVAISRIGGPQAQGMFANVKSWTDLLIALGQLGLPQGFVYAINKGYAAPGPLFRLSAVWASVFGVAAGAATLIAVFTGYLDKPQSFSIGTMATCLGVNIGGMTMFCLVRGLLLTRTDGMLFALYTIAAPVLLTILVGATFLASLTTPIEIPFAAAGTICAIIAALVGLIITQDHTKLLRTNYPVLIGQSASALAISMLSVLQPVLTFALIKLWGGDNHTIGLFNVASMAMMVSNVLFGMIAPVLFNRWSKSLTLAGAPALFRRLMRWTFIVACLSMVAIAIVPLLVVPIFGVAFAEAVLPTQILASGLAPVFYTRVAAPALLGLGLSHWNTGIAAVRTVLIGAIFVGLAVAGMSPLFAATLAWAAAEWVTVALIVVVMRSQGVKGIG